jgi:3-isopropylmalate dehydratase small subunit
MLPHFFKFICNYSNNSCTCSKTNRYSYTRPAASGHTRLLKVSQGDELTVDVAKFTVHNHETNQTFEGQVVPKFMRNALMEGGLVEYYKKHKQFPLIQT